MEGENNLAKNTGTIGIQLLLSVWSPGTYGSDSLTVSPDNPFQWLMQQNAKKTFQRDGEGWRDVWNFTDIAVRAVESTAHISGYEIDRSVPVKYGPLTEQEAIPDFYPFWFTWVTFQLTYPLQRNDENIQQFL